MSRLILVLGDLHIPDRAPDIPQKFQKLLTPGKIGQVLCLGNLTSPSTYTYLRSLAPDLHIVRGDYDLDAAPAIHAAPGSASALSKPEYNPLNLPISKVVLPPGGVAKGAKNGDRPLRIGMTHGHTIIPPADPEALLAQARQMDVDVLLWGGTCAFEAWEYEGVFFVNPGSATGANTWGWEDQKSAEGKATATDGKDVEGEEDEIEQCGWGSTPSFCLMDVQGDVLTLYVYTLKSDDSGSSNVSVEKVNYRRPRADLEAPPDTES